MIVIPVYHMILAPEATLYFPQEQLKKHAGGRGAIQNERVVLILAKEAGKLADMTPEGFYPIGAAGFVQELDDRGFALIRTQYRVNLEDIRIMPDGTVQLSISRRPEQEDLDRGRRPSVWPG